MSTNILPLISSMGLLNLPCKSLKHVKMDKVTERGTFHAVGNKKKKEKQLEPCSAHFSGHVSTKNV